MKPKPIPAAPVATEPIRIIVHDSKRVQAACDLAKAILSLARVIEGNSVKVEATIANCTFNCAGDAINFGQTIDEP